MTEIRILVDGKPALTIDMAATRHGLKPPSIRSALSRAGAEPAAWLDARTPLHLVKELDRILTKRPGRGVGGGRPPKQPAAE